MNKSNNIKTANFTKLGEKLNLQFDYEINSIKLDENNELDCKMYYFDKIHQDYRIVNYNKYWDCLNTESYDNNEVPKIKKNINKASCIKRLVSKKKRRFENEMFDLDMAYVTKRVIAMGYPATGFEKIYRNSLEDVVRFFKIYHNDNVKIYNLCLEKERIYEKTIFNKSLVGLFPSKDHNPCPIKLILEFCVDIILYLIKNPDGVAAIHCKAGKGRTGVMICCYLIFSGLCETAEEAFDHYAKSRTYNNKGVTIASQKRYIRYFENFLQASFSKPYRFLIPKIAKYHINSNTTNIINNFINDSSYFVTKNKFKLRSIEIGPLKNTSMPKIKMCDFLFNIIPTDDGKKTISAINNQNYFCITFNSIIVDTDVNIGASGSLKFSLWCNFWYSTLNQIQKFFENFHKECCINSPNTEDITVRSLLQKSLHSENISIKEVKNKYQQIPEGDDEINEKNEINDIQYSEPKANDNLFDILKKLSHTKDLNILIDSINKFVSQYKKKLFDKNDLSIKLTCKELDKFSDKKNENFSVKINYLLND